MKLIDLKLNNFQGIKELSLFPGGEDLEIRGDNATGKTTIGNALTWLLYDKPLGGEKNFSPKTLNGNGEAVHNLVHGVEATFSDNGKQLKLKKELKEKWTKKRGSLKGEFTGHETECYIDDIPVNSGDYSKRIEQICTPEQAKILTSPFYFPVNLKWMDRRELLLSVCGNVSDEQVIASSVDLAPLNDVIKKEDGSAYTIDEYLKISKSKMTKINDDLKSIPSRIDEAEKAKPDVVGIYPKVFKKEIEDHEKDIADLEKQKLNIENGQVDETLIEKKREINDRMIKAATEYSNKQIKENSKQAETLMKSAESLRNSELSVNAQKNKVLTIGETIVAKKALFDKLVDEYKEVVSKQWNGETTCQSCGQELQPDKIEAAKAAFKLNRSKRIEQIEKEGEEKCSKDLLSKLAIDLKMEEKILEKAKEEYSALQKSHQALLDTVKDEILFSDTEAGKATQAELDAINEKINTPNKESKEEIEKITAEISKTKEMVVNLSRKLLDYERAEKQELRIAELKQQEEGLAAEYEKIEANVYLCEQFIKTKVSMLTESINSRFENVRFKLFEDQINGGLKECCEVLVSCKEGLIPFATANNAGKINAGIEIIDALSKYWALDLPLIVDNAESVTKLMDTDLQVVKLVVDENYKQLQINGGIN